MKNLKSKLKNKKGESLVEVLISMLVISVSLLTLAVCINGAVNNVTSAQKKLEKYYLNNNVLSTGVVGDTSVDIDEGNIEVSNKLSKDVGTTVSVNFYTNSEFPSDSVIAYVKKSS